MTTAETTLIQKVRNQILAMSIFALASGLGMTILFINRIDIQMENVEEKVDGVETKIERVETKVDDLINKLTKVEF